MKEVYRKHFWLLAVPVILAARWPLRGLILLDDSFITYTHARNLVEHAQFTFNLGERILCTTSPLYGFLLVPVYLATGDLFAFAPLLNVVLDILIAFLSWSLLRRMSRRPQLAFSFLAIFYFLHPSVLFSSAAGMETPLFILLNLGVLWLALQENWAAAGAVSGLLLLTRPDGIIMAALAALYALARDRRGAWRGLVTMALVAGPWFLFAGWYYGSPIPASVSAKLALGDEFAEPVARKFQAIFGLLSEMPFQPLFRSVFLAGLAGMGLAVYRGVRERRLELLILPAWFALYGAAFALRGSPLAWYWYYVPLYLALYWHVGYLGSEAAQWRRSLGFAALAGLLVAFTLMEVKILPPFIQEARARSQSWENGLVQPSKWVAENSPPGATFMCYTIGIPGYYGKRRIIDPYGIATPEFSRSFTNRDLAEVDALVKARPDFFLAWDMKPEHMPGDYRLVGVSKLQAPIVRYMASWLYMRKR